MKAFLLAAGHGSRMRPLTEKLPKCLLPIRGVPLLQLWFELCHRHGIDEILINVHAHADVIRHHVAEHPSGLKLHISDESKLLGSAGTLYANRDWVASEYCFWVLYSDVLTTANLTRMLEFHRTKGQVATLGVYGVADPSRCGVIISDDNDIVCEFVEKPAVPASNAAFAGILVSDPRLLDAIPQKVPADLGFDVLPKLVGRMAAYRISEYLIDVGTPENYQAAQESWPEFKS